jgi:hypothetical protein
LLSWAVDSIGGDALIASVQALHDYQGPWRLRVDANGTRCRDQIRAVPQVRITTARLVD